MNNRRQGRGKSRLLTQTSYIYDGKVKNPAVKVYDSNAKLVSSKYYTVSKSSGRKNVGKYKYTITFKNGYSGKKTLYFTIKPKSTSITSLKKASKSFTAKWKKVSTQATKTVSKKISSLSKKKKYYVQVHTYKTVSKVNYYSSWSGKKTVVTK